MRAVSQNDLAVAAPASAFEAKFNDLRNRIGIVLAPTLFILVLLLPLPGLSLQGHRLAAIFAAVVTLWVTEAIPLPASAVLGPTVAVMMGVVPLRDAFAPFADPLIFLFIGSFILAKAIINHGLNERIAYGILSWRMIGLRPRRIMVAYAGIAFLLSMWLSNTAAAAMLLPIGAALLSVMEGRGAVSKAYGTVLILMTSYGASLGGMSTPVGTPPNLITIGMIDRYLGVHISFFQWMLIGLPAGVVLLGLLCLYLNLVTAGAKAIADGDTAIPFRKENAGQWSPAQRNVLLAFCATVGLWIIPGVLQIALGIGHPLTVWVAETFPESIAAVIGASLLFVMPAGLSHRGTMTWAEAAKIDWGTILLFGGGISLGQMAFSTRLAEVLGIGISGILPSSSLVGVTFAATVIGTVTAEAMSHTAASNIVIPIVISIAQAAGVNPVPPAIAACLGTSIGLVLPVSTPPNAIVYASGKVPITKMIRYGILADVIGVLVIPLMVLLMTSLVM